MKMMEDFKAFALKGNVIDLAVWVVIGTAFGKIVASLVSDLIMPALGIVLNGVDFKTLAYKFINPVTNAEVNITYGNFIQSIFDFTVVAFALFLFVTLLNKGMNKVKKPKKEEAAAPTPKADDVVLLEEIRDLLKKSAKAVK
jgi:large conductance mechanosensitive channel